ncbi:MAG: Neelaredoxin [Candidatus Margulisbacteria bacterium]|nr:Neelaredoxin [Candidatus Margulisiibacteriota bacterium]
MSLTEYLKRKEAEGQEKHMPSIDVKECGTCGELSVTIQVSKEVIHPSTVEHAIKTIILYGANKAGKLEQLTIFQLGDQNTVPRIRTSIKKGQYVKLIATAYCNLHGIWENTVELK